MFTAIWFIRFSLLLKFLRRTKINKKSVVNKLKCGTCPKFYIEQTGRSFKIRHGHSINFSRRGCLKLCSTLIEWEQHVQR